MKLNKNRVFIAILMAITLVISACGTGGTEGNSKGSASSGEDLRIALSVQPPNLDQPMSSTSVSRDISRLVFETLLTVNSNYEVVPNLAESYELSEDNKTYTFKLREGVKFHNGEEMTAEDVAASMNRWIEKSSSATDAIYTDATFEADGDYTVVLQLANPSALVLDTMASTNMAAAIMPKEVVESASIEGVTDYIGTGPYKLEEWKQDQYIHFTKYDEYQSVEGEPDGLAGKKEALIDNIYFEIVTDGSTRLAGLQTGEYDFAYTIQYDNYPQLESNPNMEPVVDNYGQLVLYYNEKSGLASDFKIREAVNAALNIDEVMFATFPSEDLYSLNSSYMSNDMKDWASDAGSEFYNQQDAEKAKKILEEAGYNNEEFTIMTTRDYPHLYNIAVIIQEQLIQLGMNAKLEVYDWPTVMDKQDKLGDWDAMVAGSAYVSTPPQLLYTSPTFAGGITDQYTADTLKSIETSVSKEEAHKLWNELQGHLWEEHIPVTVLASYRTLYGATNKVEGLEMFAGPLFWNAKKVN